MTKLQRLVVAAALAIGMAAPATAAITDPEVIIYRVPGVRDNGGADNVGVATVFHCTNFSGVAENIRLVTRDAAGNLLSNMVFNVTHLATISALTHVTSLYLDTLTALNTGVVAQGTTAIAATSINVICTALTIDASTTNPSGFALRGIRFNPAPGSQE
jgi:hypothetical protein